MINIVIPMAGLGSRFFTSGFVKPKPFIDINGKPMIYRVLENVHYPNARYFLLVRTEHLEKEKEIINIIKKDFNVEFIPIIKPTEGTACTVLFARQFINNDEPLLIANSDQIVSISIQAFINDCFNRKLDGSILCFRDAELNPKWSFVKTNKTGLVTEVKEKELISDLATVGIYLYVRGSYFVDSAIQMIIENDRVNNEFYTCPTYNYLIRNGKKIGTFEIHYEEMHALGTPEDYYKYIDTNRNSSV